MPERLKTLIYMQMLNLKNAYITFWVVFLGVYLVFVLHVASRYADLPPGGDARFIGGAAGVFIFLAYAGLTTVRKTLPFAPGANTTRKEYYGAAAAFLVLLAAVTAFLQTALYRLLEVPVLGMWPLRPVYYFSFSGMDVYNLFGVYWIHFITALAIVAVAFAIGCLHYRFGNIVTWIAAAVFLLFALLTPLLWWIELFMFENVDGLGLFSARMAGAAALAMLLGWLALRRVPIRSPGEQGAV